MPALAHLSLHRIDTLLAQSNCINYDTPATNAVCGADGLAVINYLHDNAISSFTAGSKLSTAQHRQTLGWAMATTDEAHLLMRVA